MDAGPPSLIAIDHDDYHAEHVGRTADGRQFFLTTPFEPAFAGKDDGQEFVALYLFDGHGALVAAKIDAFGPRAFVDDEARRATYEARLRELGDVTFTRIEIAPFAVERFGTTFGLIPRPPEEATTGGTSRSNPATTWASLSRGTAATTTPEWPARRRGRSRATARRPRRPG
ncbi:hypothetical protein ACFPIJ_44290 [Dactylosporangium cerinum]|uniref:Uncharacterized protein n=1 Tax=Dactylosporangium cerinum TaxID=1434730 RepID=A0ABV9W933_9ACTN